MVAFFVSSLLLSDSLYSTLVIYHCSIIKHGYSFPCPSSTPSLSLSLSISISMCSHHSEYRPILNHNEIESHFLFYPIGSFRKGFPFKEHLNVKCRHALSLSRYFKMHGKTWAILVLLKWPIKLTFNSLPLYSTLREHFLWVFFLLQQFRLALMITRTRTIKTTENAIFSFAASNGKKLW